MFIRKGITILGFRRNFALASKTKVCETKTLFFLTFICLNIILIGYVDSQETFEKDIKRPTPTVECIRTSQPPIIDGRLTDTSWRYSGKIENFIWANGIDEPYAPTKVFLLWDDNNFYLAIKCYEQRMDKIKISQTDKDGKVWQDDVVEIFIDPEPETPIYYHLIVNPIGTLFDQETSQKPRKDIDWDSETEVATSITSDFWLVEMAIPLFDILAEPPKVGDKWRFNLHRKEQRREEYTYWSPTYEKNANWPHVPERFGTLRLTAQPLEKPTSDALEVLNVTVKGNKVVSAEEIVDIFGLKAGDSFNMDELARGIENLKAAGWFQNVNADTSKDEKNVEIIIEVIEKDLAPVDDVRIIGAKDAAIPVFSSDKLANYFDFYPMIMNVEEIELKCRLIEQLYSYKDYIVLANKDLENNTLVIKIDAKKKISARTTGRGGYPVPPIPPVPRFSFSAGSDTGDFITFNRVRGLTLGTGIEAESTYESGGGRIYGGFSYGFSAEKDKWNYQFGLEPWFFNQHRLIAAIDVHKITQIRDETILPDDEENFIAAAIFGWNYRDYYQREGYELSLTQIIIPSNRLILKFRDDDYRTLHKVTDWSLFRGDKIKRENLPANDGRMRSVILNYQFDTRREKQTTERHFHLMPVPSHKTTNGWRGNFSVEYAKNPLGAELNEEFDFTLFEFEIIRYNRLSRHQFLDLRLKGAVADNPLPLHYKFYLGGVGSLRGYKFHDFSGGDKMILANVEYKIMPNPFEYKIGDEKTRIRMGIDINPVIFVDTGYVWKHNETPRLKDLKTDVGLGIQGEEVRINLAKPIETGEKLRINFRLRRAF